MPTDPIPNDTHAIPGGYLSIQPLLFDRWRIGVTVGKFNGWFEDVW